MKPKPNHDQAKGCHDHKHPTAIILRQDELLYDIKNLAYITGETIPDEEANRRQLVQDIGEAGNLDRVKRLLELAHAELQELLFPYTKERIEPLVIEENEPSLDKVYSLQMMMPHDFSSTTFNMIKQCAHEYMVNSVLAGWLKITYPAYAEKHIVIADDMKEKLQQAVNFRTGRVRRKQSPF